MRLNISDVTIELLERAQQLSHLPAVRKNSSYFKKVRTNSSSGNQKSYCCNQKSYCLFESNRKIARSQEQPFNCPYPSYPNISN